MRPSRRFLAPALLGALLVSGAAAAAATIGPEQIRRGVQAYTQQDYAHARELLAPAARAGHGRALFYLARMHSWGHGVARDEARASALYRRAAEAGFARAQPVLAARYMDGIGLPRDDVAAYRWLTAAARGGNRQARKLRDEWLVPRMDSDDLKRARDAATIADSD